MIAGIMHSGSGLGDQLFRYITVRTLAEKKGYEWGFVYGFDGNPAGFKGEEFMKLEWGGPVIPNQVTKKWEEKCIRDEVGNDVRSFDPESQFVQDNTIIDGSFEDDKYWRHNLDNISKWLEIEPMPPTEGECVIGFRGGEYYSDPDLGLPKEYYIEALNKIPTQNHYEVQTDDSELAKDFFSFRKDIQIIENQKISHSKHSNMAYNWAKMRYAKYAIIPNSAFYILPRILKHHEDPSAVTIAPRYWARRNTKVWSRPACYYPEFLYV